MDATFSVLSILAQTEDYSGDGGGGFIAGILGCCFPLFILALMGVVFAGGWKMFEKAGQPGWAFLIPIYNLIVLMKVVGRPLWFVVVLLIPFVGILGAIVVASDLSKRFGKGIGTTVGLVLLPFVFFPYLGFGDAQYSPPPPPEGPLGQPLF